MAKTGRISRRDEAFKFEMAGPFVVGEEDDGSEEGGYVEGTLDAVEQAPARSSV